MRPVHFLAPILLALLAPQLSAQALAGEVDLRQRVERAISTFEPLPEAETYWRELPASALDILIEIATSDAAPGHQRAGALSALGHFDDPDAERTLRAVAHDRAADARRVIAARALAQLGTRAPARAAGILETLAALAADDAAHDAGVEMRRPEAAGVTGRAAAIGALPALADTGALALLDLLVGETDDDMEQLMLHRARGEWLAAHGEPAPRARLVALAGELRQEELRLRTEASLGGEAPSATAEGHTVRLLTSAGLAATADATAPRPLAAEVSWQLERRPGAQHFWVGVEVLREQADGQSAVVAVDVIHVFRAR